ncbi:MAG: FkbM family methyltransferase [Methylacidiphilales bacterium]|nr:FkbM family methyltransferase [Candidatus Methylacidiphilales bacterium]MDW8349555.1 FkbM family methyltransferase [Verrucomicrobiae bacterium]
MEFELEWADNSQLYFGLWERETYRWIERGVSGTDWGVDVGAGAGELLVYLKKRARLPRVIAIEASESELDRIKRNLRLNELQEGNGLAVIHAYASHHRGENYIRLDDLDLGEGKIGFIKIDVEGAELDVLKGAEKILREREVRLLIETHEEKLEEECKEFLSRLGYWVKVIKPYWWRKILPELRIVEHNRWIYAEKTRVSG